MHLVFALVMTAGLAVGGQEAASPPPDPALSPAEIQKIFDGYLLVQAQDALRLTDQLFAQFVPRLKALQDTRRRHQQERMRLLMEMQRLTRPADGRGAPGDDALLKDRLNQLQESESRFAADMRKAYAAVDEVLDLRQQARFRVFEEQIERKKLELLLRARQQNPNRPLPRRPPPGH